MSKMTTRNCMILWTIFLLCTVVLGMPGKLKEQKYEFQQFHNTYSQSALNDHIETPPEDEILQVASVQPQYIPWSVQHSNEVNAFAEMFRRHYNQMVDQHNRMMRLQQGNIMANLFRPMNLPLYQLPYGLSWSNYFGNQQQYVNHQADQMSRQLIQDLQQGRVNQQEMLNPRFFVNQAASTLDRVHANINYEPASRKTDDNMQETILQQHQLTVPETDYSYNGEQQQHREIFAESDTHPESIESHNNQMPQGQNVDVSTLHHEEQADKLLVYNPTTKTFEYILVMNPGIDKNQEQHKLHESHDIANSYSNNQRRTYIQSLPPVKFDNRAESINDQQVEEIEVHTPVSVEIVRNKQQNPSEPKKFTTPKTQQQTVQTTTDNYYASTYDQQPIYDLQYLESASSTPKPAINHVMSLVRQRPNQTSEYSIERTTTRPTTTVKPTTESNVMSMLPNKKQAVNYTDVYDKIQQELQKKMMQHAETEQAETHFMGMTSNKEHLKLTYDTVDIEKDHKEGRGDQPSAGVDYGSEEVVESEPGIGYYPVNTEPALATMQPSTVNYYRLAPYPTTTPKNSNVYHKPTSSHSSVNLKYTTETLKPTQRQYTYKVVEKDAFFEVLPISTTAKANPYYSAPLAPFPSESLLVSHENRQVQAQHHETISNADIMYEEVDGISPDYSTPAVADVVQDRYDYGEFNPQQFESQHSQDYEQMQQLEDVQQSYQGMDQAFANLQQVQQPQLLTEKQFPPEQAYRNPTVQQLSPVFINHDEVPGHVVEITTSIPEVQSKQQKSWWSKIKQIF